MYILQMCPAFSTTMFAYAGATSFPTIQSDMKDSRQFFTAVLIAMAGKHILYVATLLYLFIMHSYE